ncbi:MAG: biotin/lipoyl-binding protein [Verrucomicrobiota bacterium]
MSEQQRAIFSESWHRVAGQKLRLRPSVSIRRQTFRGERWHVAQDGFTNQFFRFREEAYDFVARLDGTRTVDEIWTDCVRRRPETAPGQGEVVSLLAQLYQANLLMGDTPADTARLFERHQKRRRQQDVAQLFGIFFLRIRLFDPDRLLNRTWPALRWLGTKPAAVGWVLLLLSSLTVVFGNWDRAMDQSQSVLAPGNLLLLYAAFTVAKLIHEFGHAYAVKAFGGEVHTMGVMLLVFTPVPYVDATAAWAFPERWKRVIVGCAGMIPELAYAAIAAFVWAATGPGTLNSLAYNTMVVASVSTLLFNLNPLLRFDGYYILSDLADSPNLHARSSRQWIHLWERHALRVNELESPARTRGEAVGLTLFGAASWVYRIFITVAIILFVADRYFGLGLLAAVLAFIGAFVVPWVKVFKYLQREPRIERARRKAWAIVAGGLAAVFAFLAFVPMPDHFRAPGLVRATGSAEVNSPVSGWIARLEAPSGSTVEPGQPLVRLESPELELQLAAARALLSQVQARERQVLAEFSAGIEPMRLRREAADAQLDRLEADRAALDLRAPSGGRWVALRTENWEGLFVARGTRLGEIVGPGPGWEFQAVVSQNDASALFGAAREGAEVRFRGSAGRTARVSSWAVVPGRQEQLPGAALGWRAAGPVRTREDDQRGVLADQPFFLVVGLLDDAGVDAGDGPLLWQGRLGVIRFARPWTPFLVQWARDFRQLLQNRYRL